jgi:hypothetical protein
MITSTNPITPPELVQQLRGLVGGCPPGVDRHSKALVAIKACIAAGVDTKRHLIGVLKHVGFKPGHIANVLDPKKGPFSNSDHWWVDASCRYHLLEEQT